MEIWLRTNARAVLFGMVLPLAFGLVGLALCVFAGGAQAGVLRGVGVVMVALAVATLVALAMQTRQPRLAYCDGHLLVWLGSGPPARVPIEAVECFWLGQAPSLLPGKRHEHIDTASLVIRLADKATEWHHQKAKPQLGKWCEGYITIRGTWCEPLSLGLVNRLNQRLSEVARAESS